MRGGLDDALARMARRDEMLRRARAANGATPAVTEVTDALRRVVEDNPDLVVSVRVQDGRTTAEAQVAWRDGEVRVTVRPATPGNPGTYPRALEEPAPPSPSLPSPASAPPAPPRPRRTNAAPIDRDRPGTAASRLADMLRSDPLD